MAVTLAPAALDRVQRYLAETPDALGLRFGVNRTGCSGWRYLADLAKDAARGRHACSSRTACASTSTPTACRWSTAPRSTSSSSGLNEQFVFRNPNVGAECGCGESFTTEADAG